MAQFKNYPQKDFSPSDKYLAQDPSASGQVSRVTGQSILDAAVSEIERKGNIVQTVDLLAEAVAGDYESGTYVLVGSKLSLFDGDGVIYRVSDPGSNASAVAMTNGNELVPMFTNGVGQIDSVEDLSGLVGTVDGQQISLGEYETDSGTGSGVMIWRDSLARTVHDGVRYFSPDRDLATEGQPNYRTDVVVNTTLGVWEFLRGQIVYDLNISIPSDFATLQDALDNIKGRIIPAPNVIIDLIF